MLERRFYYFLLPISSALMLILSFPRWDQGYFGWIALLPLFFFCRTNGSSWKTYFKGGMLSGLIFFSVLYAYMVLSLDFFFPRYFGILIVIAASLYSSLFYGLFSLGVSFLMQRGSLLVLTLGSSSLWVVLEYLRSLGLLGHTGGYLGYSQSYYPLILESTAAYGYWGLSFLMVFFQGILFILLTDRWRKEDSIIKKPLNTMSYKKEILLCSFLFIFLLGAGLIMPSFYRVEERDDPLRIALAQGNIPQDNILDAEHAVENFQRYLDMSMEAYQGYDPVDLIVWPETVLSTSVARLFPDPEGHISELAGQTGADILFGAMYQEEDKEQTFNSILKQKSGEASLEDTRYDKIKLVPFAEYFPSPEVLEILFNLRVNLGMYTRGEDVPLFHLNGSSFGGIICFESYFQRPALDIAQKGGEHVFVLTNNAWFLDSNGLEQHAQAAAIRAAEIGVGVTQVANTGYTISYDYRGKEIISMPTQNKGITLLETTFPTRNTLYRQFGDYFLYLCAAILGIAVIYAAKKNNIKL